MKTTNILEIDKMNKGFEGLGFGGLESDLWEGIPKEIFDLGADPKINFEPVYRTTQKQNKSLSQRLLNRRLKDFNQILAKYNIDDAETIGKELLEVSEKISGIEGYGHNNPAVTNLKSLAQYCKEGCFVNSKELGQQIEKYVENNFNGKKYFVENLSQTTH